MEIEWLKKPSDPDEKDCVEEHEKYHMGQCAKTKSCTFCHKTKCGDCPDAGDNLKYTDVGMSEKNAECPAYQKELDCLGKKRKAAKTLKDKKRLDDLRKKVMDLMKLYGCTIKPWP